MLELNWYQEEAAAFLKARGRACALLPPRAGKSRVGIAASASPLERAVLVLAPASAILGWRNEIRAYWDVDPFIVRGPIHKRREYWAAARSGTPNYYLAVHQGYVADYAMAAVPNWGGVILDEAHRAKNRKTLRFKRIKQLRSDTFYSLTGTAKVTRGPQDLWTMLYFCDRKRFASYWKYVETYCHVFEGPFGKEIEGARNVVQFRKMLAEYVYYRTRKEIWPAMPGKSRTLLPVEMTPKQAQLYQDLATNMIAALETDSDDDFVVVANVLSQMTRLRQILCTPKLIDNTFPEYGGGLKAIGDQLEDLDTDQVVVCTPFSAAIPYIAEYLSGIGGRSVVAFHGGITLEQQEEAERKFKSEPCIAICSIRYAQGYSLSTASSSFFLGYDWDPDENLQAEDRLYGLDVTTERRITYLMHENTVDRRVLEVLDQKTGNFQQVFGSRNALISLLRGE